MSIRTSKVFKEYLNWCAYLDLLAVDTMHNTAYTDHYASIQAIIEDTPYPYPCKTRGYFLSADKLAERGESIHALV